MHCFCLSIYNKEGSVSSTLPLFQAIDPKIQLNPCEDWLWVYQNSFYLTIITGAMVGALNGICVAIFENIAPLEKCLTFPKQDMGIFQRVGLIQFMNLGCLFIFSDFSLGVPKEEMPVPLLAGNYRDFDTLWFSDIGAKVTMAMISNSISPNIGLIVEPFVQKLIIRYVLDRCFKKHLRKKTNIEEEEAANGNAPR